MKKLIAATIGSCLLLSATVFSQEGSFFFEDHTQEIMVQMENIADSAQNLQEEINSVNDLVKDYDSKAAEAETQAEMTDASQWAYVIWDTELNSLWRRLEQTLDPGRMEGVRTEEQNWISIKEIAAEIAVQDYSGGGMYPMFLAEERATITRNRVYYLASLLAEASAGNFEKPEHDIRGTYVDNQGTDSIYSSLIIKPGMEGDYTADLSIYRLVSAQGTITENGDFLLFTDEESGLTGEISYGWDGAAFTVINAPNGILHEGDVFEFPMVL